MNKLNLASKTLPNGFRIVKIHLPGFHSITNFLVIRSGSRYEDASNNGIAHFLEHMVFKGTKKYPDTLSIAEAIEGIGGHFNAWTSLDHTAYWNVVPSSKWQVGWEVPFELAFMPTLRTEDLERERGVIIEEIRMVQDDPARFVDDISGQITFANHPLGQLIIGTEENIKKMTLEQFNDYRAAHYAPSQALFIAVGDVEDKPIEELIEKKVSHLKSQPVSKPEKFDQQSRKNLRVLNKKTDQTHFMLCTASPELSFSKKERFVGLVLNTVLGRGMSSRLFLRIREQQGLAYSIHSHLSELEDTGVISIYGGVNTTKVEKALQSLEQELRLLEDELVEPGELEKAKSYVMGSFDLRADDPIELARWYGADSLLGMKEDLDQAKKLVSSVTSEQVRDMARRIFPKDFQTLAVIGPYDNNKIFDNVLELPK